MRLVLLPMFLDEELAAGPLGWAQLPDPFPSWQPEVRDH